jgi:hypothetical protein
VRHGTQLHGHKKFGYLFARLRNLFLVYMVEGSFSLNMLEKASLAEFRPTAIRLHNPLILIFQSILSIYATLVHLLLVFFLTRVEKLLQISLFLLAIFYISDFIPLFYR